MDVADLATGASGSASDRRHAFAAFAKAWPEDPVDVIIGDYLSEGNMGVAAFRRVESTGSKTRELSNPLLSEGPAFEASFLEALEPAIHDIARYGIKVVVNAGASDAEALYQEVLTLVKSQELRVPVAWVSGDEVMPAVDNSLKNGTKFHNIYTGQELSAWPFEPIYAQAYLGGMGIAQALSSGAQIVICGRVADASPVIGAAVWYHQWQRSQLHQLANALIAGHLIECSSYICGGNFAGFRELRHHGLDDVGFPIAEISSDGSVIITKQQGSGGLVTSHTCSAQLLYEIQGPWYYNSDVTAVLDQIWFEDMGMNRVALRGVQALPPPPTTKVGVTAKGGYQAEACYFLTGLDIRAKAELLEAQLRKSMAPYSSNFTALAFSTLGMPDPNADSQNAATCVFRIFAQAKRYEDLEPKRFLRPIMDNIMQGYPGATFHLDYRQGIPKPFFEYFVTLVPQTAIHQSVHFSDGSVVAVDPAPVTQVFPLRQPSQPETEATDALDFGPTQRAPLGSVAYARSGDKGSDCNCGFWVRRDDEYQWLRRLLSVTKIQELLGRDWKPDHVPAMAIDRFELPSMRAVHFLIRNHLDRGVQSTGEVDFLGKNCAEYLRSRVVDVPIRFLERGIIGSVNEV